MCLDEARRAHRYRAKGVPVLEGGAPKVIYHPIEAELITWVSNPTDAYPYPSSREPDLLQAPKLLVQADRFADNAWRLRPVVDSIGVIPTGSWQIVSGQPQTVWALNAFFSTSIASCFVHSHSIAKRIAVEVLEQIPLPSDWHGRYEHDFADLGNRWRIRPLTCRCWLIKRNGWRAKRSDLISKPSRRSSGSWPDTRHPTRESVFPDVEEPSDRGDAAVGQFNQAPGTVLHVGRTTVRVWVLGGPEAGFTVALHEGMPGWLLEKNATFELTGAPQTGRYRLHRVAHLTDEQVFGLDLRRKPLA